MELIRGQLGAPALAALRLVCRAARDDLVDGRCARLAPSHAGARTAQLLNAAPRLRRLEALKAVAGSQAECAALAAFLARLPGGGGRGAASLTRLELECFARGAEPRGAAAAAAAPDGYKWLGAAIGGLRRLEAFEVSMRCNNSDDAARLLCAIAAGAGATPAAALSLKIGGSPGTKLAGGLAALLPRQRLVSLHLKDGALDLLPQLCAPGCGAAAGAAAALTALRSLFIDDWSAQLHPPTRARVWDAPWLAQLTKLLIRGRDETARSFFGALAPGALAAVRDLAVLEGGDGGLKVEFDNVLAACPSPAAALEELALPGLFFTDVARRAELLPALSALSFQSGPEAWERHARAPGAAYAALAAAPLPPLARLALRVGPWLLERPAYFDALLSARWAAGSLVELSLDGRVTACDGAGLPLLEALERLRRLERLHLKYPHLTAAALERAAAAAAAGGSAAAAWAEGLTEFGWFDAAVRVDEVRALLTLGFSRLERLSVESEWKARLGLEPGALEGECRRALPTLREATLLLE